MTKVLTGSVPGEVTLAGLLTAVLFLCHLVVNCSEEEGSLVSLFIAAIVWS